MNVRKVHVRNFLQVMYFRVVNCNVHPEQVIGKIAFKFQQNGKIWQRIVARKRGLPAPARRLLLLETSTAPFGERVRRNKHILPKLPNDRLEGENSFSACIFTSG